MIFKRIQEYIDSFMARDPAARSRFEVVLCYPGLHAVAIYHVSHALWRRRFFVLARLISQIGRIITGIEIHPGATIGKRLFIDHGIGVVIGETSEIGDDVTLYQGVTLGGIAPSVDSHAQVNVKRHPTLRDGVIVGSGAQILGAIVVGEGARVGANAVVSRDVPPGVTAVGIPAHPVMPRDRLAASRFVAYGTPVEGCPDPLLGTIENLRGQLAGLHARVGELEAQLRHFEHGEVRDADGEYVSPKEPTVATMGEHHRR
jgi:serine O-acetyltransferase